MSVGGWNPIPCQVGGATTPYRAAYDGLRAAVGGERGAAGSFGSVEDIRRQATAFIVAAAASVQEAALAEFNPGTSTHWLRLWETILGLPREDVLQQARDNSLAAFAAKVRVDIPHLREQLRARFDPRIDVVPKERDKQAITMAHRVYADRTGVVEYGARRSAVGPAFSTAWVFFIMWAGTRTADEILQISRYLSKVLPSWCDFRIIGSTGFVCGTSLLGQTGCT